MTRLSGLHLPELQQTELKGKARPHAAPEISSEMQILMGPNCASKADTSDQSSPVEHPAAALTYHDRGKHGVQTSDHLNCARRSKRSDVSPGSTTPNH
jgi:hypothetical protein